MLSLYPRVIPLANGKGVALVDDADFERLSAYSWHATGNGYARRFVHDDRGKHLISMHRDILAVPEGMEVDHINHNKLDNRRANLRVVDHATNNRNRRIPSNNTSGYRGVSWNKHKKRWAAAIRVGGKTVYIGRYKTAEEASAAYERERIRRGLITVSPGD